MEFSHYTISRIGFFNRIYEIHDESTLKYLVKRVNFFSSRKFEFYKPDNTLILKVESPFEIFQKNFNIIKDGNLLAQVEKETFKNVFQVNSAFGNISLSGNLFHTEYVIKRDLKEIAKVSRKKFRRKGRYGIAINENEDDLFILGLIFVLVINNIQRKKKS